MAIDLNSLLPSLYENISFEAREMTYCTDKYPIYGFEKTVQYSQSHIQLLHLALKEKLLSLDWDKLM